ncbi:unnamed protein product [Rhodiola kirilowii]
MREEVNRIWGGVDVGIAEVWSGLQIDKRIGTLKNQFFSNRDSARLGGGGEIRAWMKKDLYKQSMSRDYGRGLSELARARAVLKTKPPKKKPWKKKKKKPSKKTKTSKRKRPSNEAVLSSAVVGENLRVSGVEIGVKFGEDVQKSSGLVTGNVDQIDCMEGECEKNEMELEEGEIMDIDEVTHEVVIEEAEAMEIESFSPPTSKPLLNCAMHIASHVEGQVNNQELRSRRASFTATSSTEALKAFSSYQQKFGSFERIPSPTPSEDYEGNDNDCIGEVSTSFADKNHVKSADIGAVKRLSTSSAVSSHANSRDPRLHYAGLDVESFDLQEPQLIVGNKASTALLEPKSKLNRSFESSNQDCLASKRQRNELLNPARDMNSNAGTCDLMDGNGSSGTMFSNKNQMANVGHRLRDPRTVLAGYSKRAVKTDKETVPATNNIPAFRPPEVLKNIAVNPTMLGSQQNVVGKPLQTFKEVTQLKPRDPRHVLLSSMSQLATLPMHCSAETKKGVSVPVPEGRACITPVSSYSSQVTTPDIIKTNTENLKNVVNIIASTQSENTSSVASENQSSASTTDELKTNDCFMMAEGAEGASKSQTTWSGIEHLVSGYDDHQRAAIQKERARRLEEQKKMFAQRKLSLVLDLDHTLLHSAKFSQIDPEHENLLKKKEEQERDKPHKHLFRLPHMGMWTKLRPGIWNFLEKASKLFELHLCTMGNKSYASEMAKILDPEGALFAGRVISRGDDEDVIDGGDLALKTKDLEGVLGMESSVVILDDTIRVWPHNKLNLIAVERYIYFPCSRREYGLPGPSLLEIDRDERPEDGTLASSLAVIQRLHKTFFSHGELDEADVRAILATEQLKILSGCRIVFSCVFPVAEANPHLHPLWQMAEQFGASCTNQIDDKVTHVVANSFGTNKVKWALSTGRFVVHPNWVEASALLYRRANEKDFPVIPLETNRKTASE